MKLYIPELRDQIKVGSQILRDHSICTHFYIIRNAYILIYPSEQNTQMLFGLLFARPVRPKTSAFAIIKPRARSPDMFLGEFHLYIRCARRSR